MKRPANHAKGDDKVAKLLANNNKGKHADSKKHKEYDPFIASSGSSS